MSPPSDSIRLSGLRALSFWIWHSFCWGCSLELKAKQQPLKSRKQREKTSLAMVMTDECLRTNGENVCVVKRRTWGVVIYREERKVGEGHVTGVGCWAWDILQYAWLWKPWVLHLMKFMVWGGFGISIKWQRERCFSVSIANGRNSWWRGDHAWFHFFSSWILSFLLYMQVHNLKIRLAFNFLISHFPLILLY